MRLRSLWLPSSLPVTLLLLVSLLRAADYSEALYYLCPLSGRNYTDNGAYQSNLRSLLSSLVANASLAGYYAGSAGDVPDTVYGVVLCRGDVDASSCRYCAELAAQDVVQACRYRKNAIIWYDFCLLRYTEKWSFPSISGSPEVLAMMNTHNLTETLVPLFMERLGKMMSSLANYAPYKSSGTMFATGKAEFPVDPSTPTIYGLVQCTTDQPPTVCEGCLTNILREIPQLFSSRRGARILGATCYFRYELYPFYNGSAMVSIPLPTKAPAPSPTPALPLVRPSDRTSSKENERQRHRHSSVIIAVGVVLGLAIVGVVSCVCIWRIKALEETHRTPGDEPSGPAEAKENEIEAHEK